MRFEEVRAEGLAYWLNDHQWIDWFDGEDDMITRIIDTIKRQAGNDQAQTVSPLTARIPPPVSPPPTLAATPAPDGQGSGSQWMAPVVTAVIVDLGMLAGLYFMARGMMRKSPCKPLGLRRSTRQGIRKLLWRLANRRTIGRLFRVRVKPHGPDDGRLYRCARGQRGAQAGASPCRRCLYPIDPVDRASFRTPRAARYQAERDKRRRSSSMPCAGNA